jgi:hypothetical protein
LAVKINKSSEKIEFIETLIRNEFENKQNKKIEQKITNSNERERKPKKEIRAQSETLDYKFLHKLPLWLENALAK